jgi:hypothetical protein
LTQIRLLEHHTARRQEAVPSHQLHVQLDQRVSRLIHTLEPELPKEEAARPVNISAHAQQLITLYAAFSVSRISIEKSGIASIIQLLYAHPAKDLEAHSAELFDALNYVDQEVLLNPGLRPLRNQCAYALVIILEMRKMHKGLPVLLLKILRLCSYIQFPPKGVNIPKELQGLKPRISRISQKRLKPILEDVLWQNPEYFANLPHLKDVCPRCYLKTPEQTLDLSQAQQMVASGFNRLLATRTSVRSGSGASQLSKMIIEILGLLVNVEPSPNFLKTHTHETLMIKQAKEAPSLATGKLEKLLDRQYATYQHHLKFLQESLEYYQGILDHLKNGQRRTPKK